VPADKDFLEYFLASNEWEWFQQEILRPRIEDYQSQLLTTKINDGNIGDLARVQGAYTELKWVLERPQDILNGLGLQERLKT